MTKRTRSYYFANVGQPIHRLLPGLKLAHILKDYNILKFWQQEKMSKHHHQGQFCYFIKYRDKLSFPVLGSFFLLPSSHYDYQNTLNLNAKYIKTPTHFRTRKSTYSLLTIPYTIQEIIKKRIKRIRPRSMQASS